MPFIVSPITENPHQTFSLTLGGETVSCYLWWNLSDRAWYLSMFADDGVVMGMKRLTVNQWLMPHRDRFGGGDMRVQGRRDPRTQDAFQLANELFWYEGLEIEALEDT